MSGISSLRHQCSYRPPLMVSAAPMIGSAERHEAKHHPHILDRSCAHCSLGRYR
jgi:hypothetical protein